MIPSRTTLPGTMKTLVSFAILLFSAFSLSCGKDASRTPTHTVTDSAGVTIVENQAPPHPAGEEEWTGGWSVGVEPSLSIGMVEGDEAYQFYGIAGATRLRDGRIGMVNSSSREVRIFSPDGIHLTSFGQRGGGPEEFEAPVLAGTFGDTVVVVDRAHHRFTYVHPDHGFGGPVRISDEVGGFLNPAGSFANGQAVFGGAFDMRGIGDLHNGMNRAGTFYRSASLDGSLATDFGDKDGAEFFIRDMEGEGQDSRPAVIPFGRVPEGTVSPSFFFFSDQDTYEIEVYDPTGTLVRFIRMVWEPIPTTPSDGERHIENVVAQVGSPDQEAAIRAQLGSLPLPEHFPPHGGLVGDKLDHLWVEDFQRPDSENRAWNVFDPRGVLTGRVTMPENFNPTEIGEDYLLGVGWDELNVEYVRMYPLTRGAGDG